MVRVGNPNKGGGGTHLTYSGIFEYPSTYSNCDLSRIPRAASMKRWYSGLFVLKLVLDCSNPAARASPAIAFPLTVLSLLTIDPRVCVISLQEGLTRVVHTTECQ